MQIKSYLFLKIFKLQIIVSPLSLLQKLQVRNFFPVIFYKFMLNAST
jgi:hypothetical protein